MASIPPPSNSQPPRRLGRDVGRTLARIFCCLFALIGLIPLTGGFLLRSAVVHHWAAEETARLLERHLGVQASYSLELSLWPLRVAVTDLVIPEKDSQSPALTARSIAVRPRFFSLLAGRLDIGDIEIDELRAQLTVRDGQVVNVHYELPEAPEVSEKAERAPFQTLSVSDLRLDLDLEGTRLRTGSIDADIFAERGPAFDVALRVSGAELTTVRDGVVADDSLCGLELRLRSEPDQILVRRLSLLGLADLDASSDTRGDCLRAGEDDPSRVALRLSQFQLRPVPEGLPHMSGHVFARVPAPLANRFAEMAELEGWVGFSGDIEFDGSTRLPVLTGQLSGAELRLDGRRVAQRLEAQASLEQDVVQITSLRVAFADGDVEIDRVRVAPFESQVPLEVSGFKVREVKFPGLMRDLDVTPDTIVQWDIDDVFVPKVTGTLAPFRIGGRVEATTNNFAVFDAAWHSPERLRMVQAGRARVSGHFRAHEAALEFYDTHVSFGSSKLFAKLVAIGFDNSLILDVPEGATIELAEVGPLGGLEVKGKAHLAVSMNGPAISAPLIGDLSVENLSLGGFEVGHVQSAKVRFEPLHVDFEDVTTLKGTSKVRLAQARLSFDGPASVAFDAHVMSDRLAIRDFLDVWNMGDDPRYAELKGAGQVDAHLRYVLGGPEDRCSSGALEVDGRATLTDLELFGERYTGADADFHLRWWDMEAGDRGYNLSVPSLLLRKGSGTIVGSLEVTPGAKLGGQLVGSAIPLSSLDALGTFARQWDGTLSGVARLDGTLDALAVTANVNVTSLRQGRTQLPGSRLRVRFEPNVSASPERIGRTRCGHEILAPFDLARYRRDESQGYIQVAGELWGGQVRLEDLRISQQRNKVISGLIALNQLDLGSLVPALPGWVDENLRLRGHLSGSVRLEQFFVERPAESRGELVLTSTELGAAGFEVSLASPTGKLQLADGEVSSEGLAWAVRTPTGQKGVFDLNVHVNRGRHLNATLALRDTNLGALAPLMPGVERADGTLRARLTAQGPLDGLSYTGLLDVSEGRLFLERFDTPIDALELTVTLDSTGLSIRKGSARVGGGTLQLSGSAPLVGLQLGRSSLGVRARNVALPLGEGIRVTVDSDIQAVYDPGRKGAASNDLPRITGTVDILSADYRRPMTVTADLAALTQRGKKTEVDAYDPSRDVFELDLLLRSKNALRVENELVETQLRIDNAGLRISGTNQRYGAVGTVHLVPGGRVLLRRNAFEVRQGIVRFNDPTRIAPQVDLTASTEYRRYDDPGRSETGQVASTRMAGASLGGTWRIHLHAYGEPENLRVDLTSDPAMAQDDIFLLLTVGLTRAELDQSRSAGLGSSVALEALGTLSGADQAVTDAVPVIDDFRFGSAYSTRTGRTEPTVTIGKRLSQRIRANVTTSLSDSSEVRSNVEWRMSPRVSVEGAYDNVKDIGSNQLGNLGGDIRWRLEFE